MKTIVITALALFAITASLHATDFTLQSDIATPPAENAAISAATAQDTTNTTPVIPPTGLGVASGLGSIAVDIWDDIETLQPFTSNSTAMLQVGGGVNTADSRQPIVAIALTIPLSSVVSVGCFGAYSGDGIWEDGAATVQFGQDAVWPVIGTVHEFIEDGVSHNWKNAEYGNFAGTGFQKTWALSANVSAGIGALVANDSTRPGVYALFGAHLTEHF